MHDGLRLDWAACRLGVANTACPLVPLLLLAGCPTTDEVPCGSTCISPTTQCCKTDPSVGLCKSSFPSSVCPVDGDTQCCSCPVLDNTASGTLALKSTGQTVLSMKRYKALVFVTPTASCSKTISITKVGRYGRGCAISAASASCGLQPLGLSSWTRTGLDSLLHPRGTHPGPHPALLPSTAGHARTLQA